MDDLKVTCPDCGVRQHYRKFECHRVPCALQADYDAWSGKTRPKRPKTKPVQVEETEEPQGGAVES